MSFLFFFLFIIMLPILIVIVVEIMAIMMSLPILTAQKKMYVHINTYTYMYTNIFTNKTAENLSKNIYMWIKRSSKFPANFEKENSKFGGKRKGLGNRSGRMWLRVQLRRKRSN